MNKTFARLAMILIVLMAVGSVGAAVDFETMESIKMFFAGTAIEESDVKVIDISTVGTRELNCVKIKINNTALDEMQIKVDIFVDDKTGETIWTDTRSLTVPVGQGTIPMQISDDINMSDVMRMDVVIQDL